MKIDWSPQVKLQLKEILQYYMKRNQSNAYSKKLRREVRESVGSIRRNPFFGQSISYNRRRLIIGNFVLVYQIRNDMIQILSFRDGRQNIED
jgi:toxin YoeB